MDRDAYIALIASLAPLMRRRVEDAITRILALAYLYKDDADEPFRFGDYPALDAEVNAVLRDLSDAGLAVARAKIREGLEMFADEAPEAYDDIVEDVGNDGDGALWAFDMHSSNLKKLLEGWITLAFANGWSQSTTLAYALAYMDEPQMSPMWREGIRAHLIDPFEYKFGRGYQRNIPNAMKVLGAWLLMRVVMRSEQRDARRKGAAYYICHRGSNYDCPECDAICGYPIPIEVEVLPVHSRCMCIPEYYYPE